MYKTHLAFICLILSYFNINPVNAHNSEQAFIDSCKKLSHTYAITRDAFDADAYANTFTEDGELHILGEVIKGRKAIAERINRIKGTTYDRHLISTIEVTPIDEVNATGTVYATVYEAPGDSTNTLPKTSYIIHIVVYSDTYKMTSDGCKFSSRKGELHFDQKISQ